MLRDWRGRMSLWDIDSATELGVLSLAPDAMPMTSMLGATGGYTPQLAWDRQSVWFTQAGEFVNLLVDPEAWVRAACETAGRPLTRQEWDESALAGEPYRDACATFRSTSETP